MNICRQSERNVAIVVNRIWGHRIDWLRYLSENFSGQQIRFHIFLFDKEKEPFYNLNKVSFKEQNICLHVSSTKQAVIRELFIAKTELGLESVVFWDADNWILQLLYYRGNVSVLFMRPYIQSLQVKQLCSFLIKFFLISIGSRMDKYDIALLTIPNDKHFFLKRLWVDDFPLKYPHSNNSSLTFFCSVHKIYCSVTPSAYILVPGFIEKRKRIDLILKTFKYAKREGASNRLELLFMGKTHPSQASLILQESLPTIHHLDSYLERVEYIKFIERSKFIILTYENRGSSGIAIDAINLRKKVFMLATSRWRGFQKKNPTLFDLSKTEDELVSKIRIYLESDSKTLKAIPHLSNIPNILEFTLKNISNSR
jgi:glycosyltransferase involved in cell wall biosynthesis